MGEAASENAPSSRAGREDDARATAWLRAVAAGDGAALLALYDRYGAVLLAVAQRVLGERAEAEEVLQDALTRVWLEAQSFDPERGSALTWLVTVTRNRAIDMVRSRGRRQRTEDDAVLLPEEAPPSPEAETLEAERARAVREALESLSREQRAALELAYYAGLSHSEIAEELGWPLGTVKTRIAQAVRVLRERLGPLE